jgi:Protein of unknown function (DUF3617)
MPKSILVAGSLAVLIAVLFAADEQLPLNVKPGMWQVDYNVKYIGLPPQYQAMMDQMTPQQKSAMGFDAPRTSKLCVKAKDLNKPWGEGDNCRWTTLKSTGSDLNVHSNACHRGSKAMSSDLDMDVKIHADDAERVHATIRGTATGEDGSKITLDGTYVAKWLGSTCSPDSK